MPRRFAVIRYDCVKQIVISEWYAVIVEVA